MRCVFTLFVFFSYIVFSVNATKGGFSMMLYHRDGPGTPFYNPILTKIDRLNRGIDQDLARVNQSLTITSNNLITDLTKAKGQYLMKLAFGTPPYEFFAVADTGSAKTWIQCKPCEDCYPQNAPIFEPTESSTFQTITCMNDQVDCPAFNGVDCVDKVCTYLAVYGDDSFSHGVLSNDTMTIMSITNEPVKIAEYIFGCGHSNKGNFIMETVGIIGLGRGPESLITQLDGYINGRFSYCLSQNIQGGKVNFGENAILQGLGVVTTPIIARGGDDDSPFYFATLKGLTIGAERVHFNSNPGNIIIDSGVTLTHFPTNFYKKVKNSIIRQITAKRIPDPTERLRYCYKDVNDSFEFIPITAHFDGGADIVLNKFNIFLKLARGMVCLTIVEGPKPTWGSLVQMQFSVGFDVAAGTVSFKPHEC